MISQALFFLAVLWAYLALGYGLATVFWSVWSSADSTTRSARLLFPLRTRWQNGALFGKPCERWGPWGDVGRVGQDDEHGRKVYVACTTALWAPKLMLIAIAFLLVLAARICRLAVRLGYGSVVGPTRLFLRFRAQSTIDKIPSHAYRSLTSREQEVNILTSGILGS